MPMTRDQDWDAERYAANARFVAEFGTGLIDWLAPLPGERVLDLGCGDGALTATLAGRGCVVLGVDGSAAMVAAAEARGLSARVMDGTALTFDNEFDAVFSNAALHWMSPPSAVIDGVWRALKPGGRFVGELGAEGNIASLVDALTNALQARGFAVSNPWFFPSAADYRELLTARGFAVRNLVCFPRPTPLPGDISEWLATFAQTFLTAVPTAERAGFIAAIREALRPKLVQADGTWVADYVRLRFKAVKPAP